VFWPVQPVHAQVASAVVNGFWSVDPDCFVCPKLGLGEMSIVIRVLEVFWNQAHESGSCV
jgi:hypothetical protein